MFQASICGGAPPQSTAAVRNCAAQAGSALAMPEVMMPAVGSAARMSAAVRTEKWAYSLGLRLSWLGSFGSLPRIHQWPGWAWAASLMALAARPGVALSKSRWGWLGQSGVAKS